MKKSLLIVAGMVTITAFSAGNGTSIINAHKESLKVHPYPKETLVNQVQALDSTLKVLKNNLK